MSGLADLLTNRFTLPGRTRRAPRRSSRMTSARRRPARSRVVVRAERAGHRAPARAGRSSAPPSGGRGAAGGRVAAVVPVSADVVVATIVSDLEPADAKGYTDDMRAAVGTIPGAELLVSGQAAIEHDLDPVFAHDLKVGELFIAIPIALLILVFVFGTLALPDAVPLRRGRDPGHARDHLGRRQLHGADDLPAEPRDADRARHRDRLLAARRLSLPRGAALGRRRKRTRSCGRWRRPAARSSSAARAVAIGLALMLFMPLPFMRGFGVGGLDDPARLGRRGADAAAGAPLLPRADRLDRVRLLPRRVTERRDAEHNFWVRLSRWIMRRPVLVAAATVALLIAR